MSYSTTRTFPALYAFATIFMAACGDSSGPGSVDANGALQSLALGLQGVGGVGTPTTPLANASFGGLAPLLDKVTVSIDGRPQGMYALGLAESFPDGTCEEDLFTNILLPEPGVCTPPQLGLAVIFWQAHSAAEPPDRLIVLIASVGTSDFDLFAAVSQFPAFALYAEGRDSLWSSLSGTLNSQVSATSQTCDLPLPFYAKSGTCSIATFSESGSIVFEPLSLNETTIGLGTSTARLNLVIPQTSLHGVWQAITEIQPIPLTANRTASVRLLANRLVEARINPAR